MAQSKYEIKSLSGAILWSGEAESWKDATERAVKSRADLYGANLSKADLSGANLSGAKGINSNLCTPLLMLLDQPGLIRAYKLVNQEGAGPFSGITYEIGQSYSVEDADTNPSEQCATGINVATLDWCLKEHRTRYRVLIVEFEAKDIAAIPTGTDGKFRLHRCKVVGEKDVSGMVAQLAAPV